MTRRSVTGGDDVSRWWNWSGRLPARVGVVLSWRFVRFLLVGGLNTLFGYGVFAALILAHTPYALAALLSTFAGVLFNFKSYAALVFGSQDDRRFLRFVLVYAVCYAVNLIPLAWGRRNGVSLLIVAAVMALPMALLSFVLNRRFVFAGAT